MPRLASFATALVLISLAPAWAQMRGARSMAGARAASPMGFAVHPSRIGVPRAAPAIHVRGRFGQALGLRHGPHFLRGSFHHHPFFNNFFNNCVANGFLGDCDADDFVNDFDADDFARLNFPFGGFVGGVAFPWSMSYSVLDDGSRSYTNDQQYRYALNEAQQQAYTQQQQIVDKLDRLEDRLDRLLQQQQAAASAPRGQVESKAEPSTSAVLVFRDSHTEEAQNYAIVGPTLWVFTAQKARKIPLADLDLAATSKENASRGLEFSIPAPH